MIRTAVLVLALLAIPERAPERFRCPDDPGAYVGVVGLYSYEDVTEKAIVDRCDFAHWHDAGFELWSLECARCGNRWSVKEDAPACLCGWSASYQVWSDPCPEDVEP